MGPELFIFGPAALANLTSFHVTKIGIALALDARFLLAELRLAFILRPRCRLLLGGRDKSNSSYSSPAHAKSGF
jgi:hypothetical protein